MSIHIFSITGYAHLYRSLIRFSNLTICEARSLVYRLNTSNLDSARLKHPNWKLKEATPFDFIRIIENADCRPYRTEVQLYKALCALDRNIIEDALTDEQREAVAQMHCVMCNLEYRFYKTFDHEIFDIDTVYCECAFGLVPWEDEPSVCLVEEWLFLPSA